MTGIGRILKSDFVKLRRSPLLYVHILIPVIGICAYSVYAFISTASAAEKITGYFQFLGFAFPAVIGIVSAMVTEQELMAGNGYYLLTSASPKVLSGAAKIILLLVLALFAVFLAACGFGFVMNILLKENVFPIYFYFQAGCILLAGNIALYIIHFFVSLRFGKGAGIGLGIIESLVAALMLTGLGEGIWYMLPCAWSIRFTAMWTAKAAYPGLFPADIYRTGMAVGIPFCFLISLVLLSLVLIWFGRWEGRKSYD